MECPGKYFNELESLIADLLIILGMLYDEGDLK